MTELNGKVALVTGAARGQGRSYGFLAPEDITRAVLYLVGDGGRWVTGTSLKVDAGATVTPPGRWRDPASTS